MATHSSILAWRIPMDRGAWRATVHRVPGLKQLARLHRSYIYHQKEGIKRHLHKIGNLNCMSA